MRRRVRGPGTITVDDRRGVIVLTLPPREARELADVIRSGVGPRDRAHEDADLLDEYADRLDPPPEDP